MPDWCPRILAISTAHLTNEDRILLESRPARYAKLAWEYEYGWFVRTGEFHADELYGISETTRKLLLSLNERGFYYVQFDSDAEKLEDFPTFEW